MKNIIWLFAVRFLIQDGFCNDILSKFHQNEFKLKDVRMQLMDYDKDMYNLFEIKAFKYNRTTTAHNCTFNFKIDVKDELEVLIQAHKFLSNEYRHFPALRFQVNFKKVVDSNTIGMGEIRKCGNMASIYFYKDVSYYFCNFVVDETQFPPLIPNGRYRFDLTYMYRNKDVAWAYLYGEIYTPMKYPKK